MFFNLFFDRIYGLAYRLLGTRIQAEDATQEVCYRIQRGAHRLDLTRDPTPWVLTTTVNVCRSLRRSSAYRMDRASQSIEGSSGAEWASDPSHAPDEELLVKERERLVFQAVQELDEAMREIVVLHDYQGFDHKEIASALGLSHEAVRKRYSRALSSLAQRLRSVIK
jgi:RNA polymerase sigma-70 factor (ECF subfamily)